MKAAAITITPKRWLGNLHPAAAGLLREFFTNMLVGADPVSHRRWIRLIREIFSAPAGAAFQLYRVEGRSDKFHAFHRAILTAIFERQEIYPTREALHDWLKLECWFIEWTEGKPSPRSTDFESCSEDEIQEFNARLQYMLYDPVIQAHLWPHLSDRLRLENVTAILTNPKDHHEHS